ncbi:hypothetical protein [Thalassotalea sp. PP2-459]|uniref:hypothetical protein n=1 Tax=Thalassotalea sp. PP2-459 TaxID=1742724 RepID=UPI0009425E93|nr:hypothetical protein [Thalassotalea sp. PP2-459]OKY26062.1 hypothetical protein BI291_14225 [Thalassotalea sp. PP2-459]
MKPLSYCIALIFTLFCSKCAASLLQINEIHYDNAGSDKNEFVELIGNAGTDLSHWSLLFYNGGNGKVYKNQPLTGTLANNSNGYGFATFYFSGIQNGSPDGIALVNNQHDFVSDFISYEGRFVATNGAATGLVSTDILVTQPPSTAKGMTLQRTGSLQQVQWQLATSSPNAINQQQLLTTMPVTVSLPTTPILFSLSLLLLFAISYKKSVDQHYQFCA